MVTKPDWFNYESVIQSLRDFCRAKPCPEGKKYCIILDNAPWHRKAIRLIWKEQLDEYADIRNKMEYLPLPAYSPDLSPIEQLWRKTRRENTHNRGFGKLVKLIDTLDNYFAGFFAPKPSAPYAHLPVLSDPITHKFYSFTISPSSGDTSSATGIIAGSALPMVVFLRG